jgi:murein DD-endopeptidase MepM/ murein hydrolase activator NlpD
VRRTKGFSQRTNQHLHPDPTAVIAPLCSAPAQGQRSEAQPPIPTSARGFDHSRSAAEASRTSSVNANVLSSPSGGQAHSRTGRIALILLIVAAICGMLAITQPFAGLWPLKTVYAQIHRYRSKDGPATTNGAPVKAAPRSAKAGSKTAPKTAARTSRSSKKSKESAAVSASGHLWPTTGVITQEFGCTDFALEPWNAEFRCRFHSGIDIANAEATPIRAALAGSVVFAGWGDDGYGYRVLLDDGGGVQTLYGHLCCSPELAAGQAVAQGEQIGLMGTTGASSGNHLHFAVIVDGIAVNPRDYLPTEPPGG